MREIKVKKTNNYSMFKTITGNRLKNENHLKKLKKSLQENNHIQYRPILVNEKMEVIDGQHRIKTAEELKLPVHYIVGRGLGLDDVQTFNNVCKNWTLYDYLTSNCTQGNKEYLYLKDFYETYNLPLTVCVALLSNSSSDTTRDFKYGKFIAKRKKEAEETAGYINSLVEKQSHYRARYFIIAVSEILKKGVNRKRLSSILEEGIQKCTSKDGYLAEIQKQYNYNLCKKNRLLFVSI